MNQSTEIGELASALSKAQAEYKTAKKDNKNPFFRSNYADLNTVMVACRPHITKNNLAIVQTMDIVNDKNVLITTLMHSSGQWIKSITPILSAKNDSQGYGAGTTYARRFALEAIVGGTASEDDDGNEACRPTESNEEPTISKTEIAMIQEGLKKCTPEHRMHFLNEVNKTSGALHNLKKSSFQALIDAIQQTVSQYPKDGA